MDEKNRTYSLCALVLEENPEISLSEDEFSKLKQAKSCLNSAFALEENYDLLLSNYRELELEAISAAFNDMTVKQHAYEDFFEVRTVINRRVVNLLSATRMYLDQYLGNLKKIGIDSNIAKTLSSEQYDNFFEYRFMEALRNHTQHAGHAVHGINMGKRRLHEQEPKRLQYSITPYAAKYMLEGTKFKASVLKECPDKVAIIPAARIHVGGISSIHKKVRELSKGLVQEARDLFEEAILRHEKEAQKNYLGLAAIAKENGDIVEQIPIFLNWDDVRQKLVNKNWPVENLNQRFVTSEEQEGLN